MQGSSENTPAEAFTDRLRESGMYPLKAAGIDILQLNITRRCNLSCKHCHVQAGPDRTEIMSHDTLARCIQAARHPKVTVIDITGGAPELHPDLEWLISELAGLNKRLIVRTNLVVMLDPEYRRFMDIFAAYRVELVGSLPDYHAERTDRQRGAGIFERVIRSIRELNQMSYGIPGSGLTLNLVHNPAGAYLPGPQAALEAEYRRVLRDAHGISFNNLFCLINCPVGRYLDYLKTSGNLNDYMRTLRCAFNPSAVESVMCRTTLSVGWDGRLYDCDFNQMLNMTVNSGAPAHIRNFDFDRLAGREVVVRSHCFACTAGSGSSCQGSLSS
jgi:radical SAM/Cys-rich protein